MRFYDIIKIMLNRKVVRGMKQSYFTGAKELFPGSDVVRKYTFKTIRLGDSYALLAVICPILVALSGLLGEKYALFQEDCFECLSPHKIAA